MRVLVTRPEPGGKRTAERLARLGHQPVPMPLFSTEITATPDDLPPAGDIAGLIATSGRAFAMFGPTGVSGTGLERVPVHAVGPATAQAALEAGFDEVADAGGTAKALADGLSRAFLRGSDSEIVAGQEPRRGILVYLAGVPRTPTIEAALRARGTGFQVVDCYKMEEISYSTDTLKTDFLSPAPEAVLLYSANAARRFSDLVGKASLAKLLDSTCFICLSPSIADQLPAAWKERSIVTGRPDEDSLLASLAAVG